MEIILIAILVVSSLVTVGSLGYMVYDSVVKVLKTDCKKRRLS